MGSVSLSVLGFTRAQLGVRAIGCAALDVTVSAGDVLWDNKDKLLLLLSPYVDLLIDLMLVTDDSNMSWYRVHCS